VAKKLRPQVHMPRDEIVPLVHRTFFTNPHPR
jgi:hypothetical protein